MRRFVRFAVLFLGCFAIGMAVARAPSYQVDVIVEKNQASHDKAFYDALQQLLSRLSDSPLDMKGVTKPRLMQTISQYRYHTKEGQSVLTIDFDKEALNALMSELGLFNQSENNLKWVVWIAKKDGEQNDLIGGTPSPKMISDLTDIASRAHFDLIVPEMDLEDMDKVSFNDVWSDNKAGLIKASERYGGDGILIIKLVPQKEDKWAATWILSTEKQDIQFELSDLSLSSTFQAGIEQLETSLSEAIKESASEVLLEVGDVHSTNSYQSILTFLKGLPGVEQVELDGVTPDTVLYKLTVTVSKSSLRRAINKNKMLTVDDKPQDKVLYYRLNS